MPNTVHTPSPCHCLAIRQAARRVTQLYDAHLAPTGLRSTQYSVLRMLAVYEPLTMQGLADRVIMDRTTLSRALRPLERDGLVRMEPGQDARTRLLSVTPVGRTLLEQATLAWDRAQATFEASYGQAETQDLRGRLAEVVARVA